VRLQQAVDEVGGLPELLVAPGASSRFITEPRCLRFGEPVDNVFGIEHFMHVAEEDVMAGMVQGVRAIEREVETHGTEVDKECLHYLLHEEAGSSTKEFQHGLMRDRGPNGEILIERQMDDGHGGKRGMRLADFVSHPSSRTARLREAHVLALRLYSTAAFNSINGPLRDLERFKRGEPHRLPVTVALLRAAVMKLRAVNANVPSSNEEEELWRGMADVEAPAEFLERGGSELAPMSTTFDLKTAVKYSASRHAVLLRLRTSNFLMRGADITYLSAFPGERECLFPPLTYLAPEAETVIKLGNVSWHIIDVHPQL